MHRRTFLKRGLGAAMATLAMPHVSRAQGTWPNKPVRIIVPFAAGGGTDIVARPWADKLGQIFGQPFVIENRGGASGMIGTEAVARATADGYTMLISSNTSTVNLPLLRQVPYDPKQLEPIARMGDAVTGFALHPSTNIKTFPELLDNAKKNPGKLVFGSSGPGTGPHLRLEMLKFRTGVDIMHVPYRGGADSLNDLLAGHIHIMNEPVVNPHVKAGKLNLVNINHFERSVDFPDIPTLTELGYPNSDAPIWISLWCPAGTPAEIKQRLNAEILAQSKGAEMREKLRLAGSAPVLMTLPEIEAFRAADAQLMADLIKSAKIKIE